MRLGVGLGSRQALVHAAVMDVWRYCLYPSAQRPGQNHFCGRPPQRYRSRAGCCRQAQREWAVILGRRA